LTIAFVAHRRYRGKVTSSSGTSQPFSQFHNNPTYEPNVVNETPLDRKEFEHEW
jgi:hypothetical protein